MMLDAADPGKDSGRNRRLIAGISTALLGRGIAALVPLVMVPITLRYLGVEIYGVWMAVLALTGMVAFADLGFGNGLMTKLAACYANEDWHAARKYVSTAYAVTSAFAFLLLLSVLLVSPAVPWASVFDIADPVARDAAPTVAVISIGAFIVNVPLSLVTRVQYAYQRVGQANVWQAGGSLLSLAGALATVAAGMGSLAVITAVAVGPPIMSVLTSAWVYRAQLRELAPRFSAVDRGSARALLRLGSQFVALTAVMSVATNADNLIIANALGVADLPTFAVPARLVGQLGLLVSLINVPLWAANGEAMARGDVAWVRRSTRRMTLISGLLVAIPGIGLVLGGDEVLQAWLGTDIGASPVLLGGLVAWWFMLAGLSPSYMVQNSVGLVHYQLIGWVSYLVLSVPSKFLAAHAYGLDVVPWAGVVVYAATALPAALVGSRVALSRASGRAVPR